jgi:hypothetical protein
MPGDFSDTRRFDISTDDLQSAIIALEARGGASMYQQAWRVLTTELGKRKELKAQHGGVSIAQNHFDPLPEPVKAFLTPSREEGG